MICFNCGLKLNNHEEKECRFCGVKFSSRCHACAYPNPVTARFCCNCGSKLAGADSRSSVENFGTLTESRKNVAVMFADVSGFTALSERMDPEEVREIINECFNYITSPVYELEGTIDKYIGDCVMVLFGARYSHADDAKRAVLCAMKMMDLIRDFSQNVLSSRGVRLNLSIGVNYGLVVTGGVGNYFDRDYTVMGDIVNTAQRLQASAGEGVILVSESVSAETAGWFEFTGPREVRVKNKENPVKCYTPVKAIMNPLIGRELSFVDRQREMGLLNGVYNDAMNTGLQYISLVGEAGIGKTRLLKEFSSSLGNDVKKVWVDCNTVFQTRSYSLISGVLAGIMNINPLDSGSMKQHRLISFLDYILGNFSDEEIKRNYDFLGLLMGLDRDIEFQKVFASMNYENARREMIKQLALFFTHLCKKHKLVILVDDAQWADNNSIQLLNELVPLLPDIKAVFILASRYELKSLLPGSGKDKSAHRLEALTRSGVKKLVCSLLGCTKIEDGLFDAILGVTKGNPLYVKELVTSMKRKGGCQIRKGTAVADQAVLDALPSNIQNLLLSNLSGLDETTLKILQAASVIGKEFPVSLVRHLLENSAGEDEIAGIPVQLGMIELKAVHTSSRIVDKIYEFTHEIEREVIYDSILNRQKKSIHKRIAEYVESRYEKELENYLEILCEHFHKAGMLTKAADYYYRAALKHSGSYDFSSALECFGKYLELCGKQPEGKDAERTANSYKEMGRIHSVTANYDKSLECYDLALENTKRLEDIHSIKMLIAEVHRDRGLLDDAMAVLDEIGPKIREDSSVYGRWLQMRCYILRIQGDPAALSLAKKSEKILLKARDYQNLSETMKNAGLIHFFKGEIDNALSFMNKSYKYAEKNNSLDLLAKVSGDLGIIYYQTGMSSEALDFYNKSMEISKKISYQRGVVAACINLGILYLDQGQFNRAKELFTESLNLSRELGSKLYECASLTNLGDIAYEMGDFDRATACYLESLALSREINAPVEEGVNDIGMVKVALKCGQRDQVADMLESAGKIFTDADEAMFLADYHIYRGVLEEQSGYMEAALASFERAETIADSCRNDRRKVKAMRMKGFLLTHLERFEEAENCLEHAAAVSERIESDYDSAKCWYGISKVMEALGRREEAQEAHSKAKDHMRKVDRCRWTGIIGI